MRERVSDVWETYGPTNGPGHTDHPRVDIQTHRSIARTLKWGGIIAGLAVIALFGREPAAWVIAGLVFAVAQLASLGLRVEALEWEVQLDDE